MKSIATRIELTLSRYMGALARDTLKVSIGMGLRTAFQALTFLALARVLGITSFGYYTAVLALAGILGYFGGSGVFVLMMRKIARKPDDFSLAWQHSLGALVVSGPFLLFLYILVSNFALPPYTSMQPIMLIGLSEIWFAPLVLTGIHVFQGHEKFSETTWLMVVPVFLRFLAVLILVVAVFSVSDINRLQLWSWLYLISAIVAGLMAMASVKKQYGVKLKPVFQGLAPLMVEGSSFSFGGVALRVYADIDKTMLARLDTLQATGGYSAAYRVVDLVFVPISALLTTSLSKFFRAGGNNLREAASYGWRLLPIPMLYLIVAIPCMYFIADLLPVLLGESYRPAIEMLRFLAFLPLLSLPRGILQNVLIGADKHSAAIRLLVTGAIINISLNLYLIPEWGWRGAALATYISETSILAALLFISWRYIKFGAEVAKT